MADDQTGRTSGAPTASGDTAGNPSSQPLPGDNPSPVVDHDAEGAISEEDAKRILDGFAEGNSPDDEVEDVADDDADDDDEANPDDDVVTGDAEDDSDLFDDDPDRSGADDADDDEGDSQDDQDEDEDEENADELNEVQGKLDEKARKSFARMRVQLKEARKALEVSKTEAAFGKKMSEVIDRFGLSDEQLYDGLRLVSTVASDPLQGIQLLKEQMAAAVQVARERYPKLDLSGMLDLSTDDLGSGGSTLPDDLQEMVDEGRITEERAREIADAMNRKDDRDARPETTPQAQIEETNAALRAIGFYRVESQQELEGRIQMLIPAMERLADKLGLDMQTMSHSARKELAVRAGKAVLAHLNGKAKSKPKRQERVLRNRDGGKPRQQSGEPKTWDEVHKAVVAGFTR